ncbi:MAG: phage/plasmid replication protein, II/X family [Panacagrimonas sp.]
MLVDWLTLRYELRNDDDRVLLDRCTQGRTHCEKIKGGELVSMWWPRDKTTDTHRVTVGLSLGAITIEGSPARVMGDSNVFGSGDPSACCRSMIEAAGKLLNVRLPPAIAWKCTRLDLTQNYDCGPHVAEALDTLRHVSGGHLKVSSKNNGCYWNPGSDLWSAVAYMKGPHLARQARAGKVREPQEHVELAHRLLRLEVRIRNQYMRRCRLKVTDMTEEQAMVIYSHFARKILPPDIAITDEQQLLELIVKTYGPRLGRALIGTWGLVKALGPDGARERMSSATWIRHQRYLAGLGVGKADLHARKIVTFRPRPVNARPVDSWEQLKRAA